MFLVRIPSHFTPLPLPAPVFSRLYNLHPCYWNTLSCSLISFGENSSFMHFAVHNYIHNSQVLQFNFLIPPDTHHCWVAETVGYGMRSFPALLHVTSNGDRIPDVLILSLTPYHLGYICPQTTTTTHFNFCWFCWFSFNLHMSLHSYILLLIHTYYTTISQVSRKGHIK